MAVTSTGYQLNKQPIAQSFFIDEPNGIYVTKVDLFFDSEMFDLRSLPLIGITVQSF